jgi:hypothetical protein
MTNIKWSHVGLIISTMSFSGRVAACVIKRPNIKFFTFAVFPHFENNTGFCVRIVAHEFFLILRTILDFQRESLTSETKKSSGMVTVSLWVAQRTRPVSIWYYANTNRCSKNLYFMLPLQTFIWQHTQQNPFLRRGWVNGLHVETFCFGNERISLKYWLNSENPPFDAGVTYRIRAFFSKQAFSTRRSIEICDEMIAVLAHRTISDIHSTTDSDCSP